MRKESIDYQKYMTLSKLLKEELEMCHEKEEQDMASQIIWNRLESLDLSNKQIKDLAF